jgi:hypothetical protein
MHGKDVKVELIEQHLKEHHCKKDAICPQGCGYDQIQTLEEGIEHYKRCPESLVPCEICKVMVLNKNLEEHQLECRERFAFCKECGESILIENMKHHLDTQCPEVMVQC